MRSQQPNANVGLTTLPISFFLLIFTFTIVSSAFNSFLNRFEHVGELPVRAGWPKLGFISPQQGWFLENSRVWLTNNGGITWAPLRLPDSNFGEIYQVRICDTDRVLLGASRGIFWTSDGGDTWAQLRAASLTYSYTDTAVSCSSGRVYMAGGRFRLARTGEEAPNYALSKIGNRLHISRPAVAISDVTRDNWTTIDLPEDEGYRVRRLIVLDENRAFAVTEFTVFVTADGGSSWTASEFPTCGVPVHPSPGPEPRITAVHFLDGRTGWLAYEDGRLARTKDAGRTWCTVSITRLRTPYSDNFQALFFRSELSGLALSSFNHLYETFDGGTIWREVPTPEMFKTLVSSPDSHAWLASESSLFRVAETN